MSASPMDMAARGGRGLWTSKKKAACQSGFGFARPTHSNTEPLSNSTMLDGGFSGVERQIYPAIPIGPQILRLVIVPGNFKPVHHHPSFRLISIDPTLLTSRRHNRRTTRKTGLAWCPFSICTGCGPQVPGGRDKLSNCFRPACLHGKGAGR